MKVLNTKESNKGLSGATLETSYGEYHLTCTEDLSYYVSGPRYISGGVCSSLIDAVAKVAHDIAVEEAKVYEFED